MFKVTCFRESIAPLTRVLDGKFARDAGATKAPTHDSVTSVKQAARRAMVSHRVCLSDSLPPCLAKVKSQEFVQILVGILGREHSK